MRDKETRQGIRSGIAIALLLISNVIVAMLMACGSAASPDKEEWPIGVILPTSGDLAAYGGDALKGLELMAEKINKAGGINGKPIKLYIENNEGETTKSSTALRKLLGLKNVLAIVGGVTSTNTRAIAPEAQKKGVVLITPTGTNDTLTADRDFIFRACFNDSFQGVAVAKFAREELKLKSAIPFQDSMSDYSVGLCKSFAATFEKLGGTTLETLSYKQKDTEFTPQLRAVREAGAGGLFVPGYPPELPKIVNEARNMNLDTVLLGADGWDNNDLVTNSAANLNGTYFAAAFSEEVSSPELKDFLALTHNNGISNPGSFEALGYDSLGLLAQSLEQATKDATFASADLKTQRQILRDKLANLKGYKGATGTINMNPSGDPEKSLVILQYQAEGGKVTKKFVKIINP